MSWLKGELHIGLWLVVSTYLRHMVFWWEGQYSSSQWWHGDCHIKPMDKGTLIGKEQLGLHLWHTHPPLLLFMDHTRPLLLLITEVHTQPAIDNIYYHTRQTDRQIDPENMKVSILYVLHLCVYILPTHWLAGWLMNRSTCCSFLLYHYQNIALLPSL